MDNRGKRWSEEEEDQMISLFENGATPDAVASRHGRSTKAVLLRLGAMAEKGNSQHRLRRISEPIITKAKEMLASEAATATPLSNGRNSDSHALMKILAVLEEIREEIHKMRSMLKKK